MSRNNPQSEDRLKLLGRVPTQATQELALPPRIRTAECHKPIATVKAVVQRHGWGEGRLTQEQIDQLSKQRELEEQLQREKLDKLKAYHASVVKRAAAVQKDMQLRKMQLHKQLDQASRLRDTHKTYAEKLLKAVKQRAASSKAIASSQQEQLLLEQARLQEQVQSQVQSQAAGGKPAIARNPAAMAAGRLFMQTLQHAAADEGTSRHELRDDGSSSERGTAGPEAGGTQEPSGSTRGTADTTSMTGVAPAGGTGCVSSVAAAAADSAGCSVTPAGGTPPTAVQEVVLAGPLQAELAAMQLEEQAAMAVEAASSHLPEGVAAAESLQAEVLPSAAATAARLDPAAATQRLAAWSSSTGAAGCSHVDEAAAGPMGEALAALPEAAPYAAGRLAAGGRQPDQGAAAVVSILAAEAEYKDCSRAGASQAGGGPGAAPSSGAASQVALVQQRSSHAVTTAPLLPDWLNKATLATVTAEVHRRGIHLPRLCPCPHDASPLDPAYPRHCCVNCPLRLDAVAAAKEVAAAGSSGGVCSCSSRETVWSRLLKSTLQSYGVWPLPSMEAGGKAAGGTGRGTSTLR